MDMERMSGQRRKSCAAGGSRRTGMEWLMKMNQALGYIEEHLHGEISYKKAADIACCSSYHFQRMFTCIVGVPLGEYIRRRRLTLAALDLQSGAKVIDVALKYGYDSPTAFNRAFQSMHGMAPSLARKEGMALKAYPRISFKISIKGDSEMEYRIEKKEAFRIVGVKASIDQDIEKSFQQVPMFWGRVSASPLLGQICMLMNGEPKGMLGVCGTEQEGTSWDYYIAVASDLPLSDDMVEYTVPANTWAIFPGKGPMPQSIQEIERRAITEWLPTSGYEYANGPDIELYLEPNPADTAFEVWVPIAKKAE